MLFGIVFDPDAEMPDAFSETPDHPHQFVGMAESTRGRGETLLLAWRSAPCYPSPGSGARTEYSAYTAAKVNNWRFNAYTDVLWQNKSGWEVEGRFDFNGYSGFSYGYNKPEYLLNLKLTKE